MEDMEDEEEVLGFSDSDEDDTDRIIEELGEKQKQLHAHRAAEKLANKDNYEESVDSESELSDNALEEKEARLIQRRHAQQISEDDFDYEFAQLMKAAEAPRDKKEKIHEDLSSLSSTEKWQLIKNTSPDLLPVINRYKSLLSVCTNALSCSSVNSADVRDNLSIDFCMNISMYLILKISQESDIHNHPVSQRLLDYQMLMQQLESAETKSKRYFKTNGKQPKQLSHEMLKSSDEEESIIETTEEITDVGRRTVTDQILRNRGLTPHRKKEYKNPRVKHRMKYRRAVIRRRGQIRPVRNEMTAYAGETSGIRAAVKRGIRLKA